MTKDADTRRRLSGGAGKRSWVWRGRTVTLPSARLTIFLVMAVVVAAGGGSSKATALPLLYVRPALVLCIGALALTRGPWDFRSFRAPLALLAGLALVMIAQLIPLPPLDRWVAGRARLTELDALLGASGSWRPISLAPDRTINSLLALLPSLAVLVTFAGLDDHDRRRSLYAVVGLAACSAVLGVIQLAGGANSAAYIYASDALPVGLLANRNHQAALLAIGVVGVAALTTVARSRRPADPVRPIALALITALLVMVAVVAGSRSGLLLLLVAGAGSAYLMRATIVQLYRRHPSLPILAAGGLVAILALVAVVGRGLAFQRLAQTSTALPQEYRLRALPVLMRIIEDFFPIGTGFGTFDPVYRIYEPDRHLHFTYFNNAHDDYLEVLLTGGLPAVMIVLAAIGWILMRVWRLVRNDDMRERTLPVLAAAIIAILMIASVFDYPLRTPLMGFVGTIAIAWLAKPESARRRD